ncbi:MAG: pilus assembly protein, partial [Oligosphaeraceae bacterium]|nr:pilus assembly protein [Oligosphaeraceae bacterium]
MKKISCAGSDSGTVLLETVLVMPILLSFFIGTWQMALLWQARQVVAYAAYAAARAGMVETAGTAAAAAEAAAEQVCTLVGMPSFNYLADGALVEYDFATST